MTTRKLASKATKAKPKAKASENSAAPLKRTASSKPRELDVLSDWKTATLERMRRLILAAEPDIVEERKWKKPSNNMLGVPVWSLGGIICTGEMYKHVVKLTFARGAALPDPSKLFNASLEGGTRRAIDLREGESVDEKAFKALIRSAVAANRLTAKGKSD